MIEFEVCATTLAAVHAAKIGGANRVELCTALDLGGVTPSPGIIQAAVATGFPIHVLLRPREGDFCYSPDEIDALLADMEFCRNSGAAGVVIGCLTPNQNLDLPALKRISSAAKGLHLTFHRAFDCLSDPFPAIHMLAELGFGRILTSGQAPSVVAGMTRLSEFIRVAGNTIDIMPGGGVTPENVKVLLETTRAKHVHFSAKKQAGITTSPTLPGLESKYWTTDPQSVQAVVHAALMGNRT